MIEAEATQRRPARQIVPLRICDEDVRQIDQIAVRLDESRNHVIRRAIRAFLREQQRADAEVSS